MKLCITNVSRPVCLGALYLNGDDYSTEHDLACILPYLLHPLQRQDIEALASKVSDIKDEPTMVPSGLLRDLARTTFKECTRSTMLVKPLATAAWLTHAWGLATLSGSTQVQLATAATHPIDIESNSYGFMEHRESMQLSPVGPGLLCAVLSDTERAEVDPIRVLALGFLS